MGLVEESSAPALHARDDDVDVHEQEHQRQQQQQDEAEAEDEDEDEDEDEGGSVLPEDDQAVPEHSLSAQASSQPDLGYHWLDKSAVDALSFPPLGHDAFRSLDVCIGELKVPSGRVIAM